VPSESGRCISTRFRTCASRSRSAEHWEQLDRLALMQQLGVVSAPGAHPARQATGNPGAGIGTRRARYRVRLTVLRPRPVVWFYNVTASSVLLGDLPCQLRRRNQSTLVRGRTSFQHDEVLDLQRRDPASAATVIIVTKGWLGEPGSPWTGALPFPGRRGREQGDQISAPMRKRASSAG
jgi:hypothetical protein